MIKRENEGRIEFRFEESDAAEAKIMVDKIAFNDAAREDVLKMIMSILARLQTEKRYGFAMLREKIEKEFSVKLPENIGFNFMGEVASVDAAEFKALNPEVASPDGPPPAKDGSAVPV